MTPVLVFDIETVPDIEGLRLLYGLGSDMSDDDVAEMAFQRRRQADGQGFSAAAPASSGRDLLRAARPRELPRLVAR